MRQLVFKFPERAQAEEFMVWLSEVGEQEYWEYIDSGDEERKQLKVSFKYNYVNLVVDTKQIS